MAENRKYDELHDNIRLAVEEGREDLAEAAISKQMDIEAQIPVLETAITDAGNQERELESYVNALGAKKREMHSELEAFRNSQTTVSGSKREGSAAPGSGADAKVESATAAFDRVMRRASGVPGSVTGGNRKTEAQLAELDELARSNRVKERLAQIKADAKS